RGQRLCRTATRREPERADPGAPVERAVRLQVLIRVPERAVVDWINGHRAVVTPTRQVRLLRARPGLQDRLRCQRAERGTRTAARVADGRIQGRARCAVT